MSTKVLLTSEMAKNHRGQNICYRLTAAVKEWELLIPRSVALFMTMLLMLTLGRI